MLGNVAQDGPMVLRVHHVRRELAAEVEVKDPSKPLEIALKPAAVIKGLVVADDGKPLANAKVRVVFSPLVLNATYLPPDESYDETVSDDKGQYQFKAVLPGRYKVEAAAEGFGPREAPAKVQAGKDTVEVAKITLKPLKFSVSGVVKDVDGKPVAGAKVHHYSGDWAIMTTDKDGKFTVNKLEQGKVLLQADTDSGMYGRIEANTGDKNVQIIIQKPK